MSRRRPPRKQRGVATGPRRVNGELLDVATAARQLGITEKMLRSQLARRLLPHRRLGGRVILIAAELHRFIAQLPGVHLEEALENVAARQRVGGR